MLWRLARYIHAPINHTAVPGMVLLCCRQDGQWPILQGVQRGLHCCRAAIAEVRTVSRQDSRGVCLPLRACVPVAGREGQGKGEGFDGGCESLERWQRVGIPV